MRKYVSEVLESHGYDELRETQEQAIDEGLLEEDNNLIVAETGNGKTMCAEFLMNKKLEESSGRIVYCVPSRQLVRDKKKEFSDWFDGDISAGSMGSEISVLTFESFYHNLIRGRVDNVSLVVLDDFHEMYSSYRGVGIEKVITICKDYDIPLLSMSATIGNPEKIASWMDANLIVSNENRGVKIEEEFVEYSDKSKVEAITDFVGDNGSKAPFLLFNSSRRNAISRAKKISSECDLSDGSGFSEDLEDIMGDDMTDTIRALGSYMESGVAFHHAGLPSEVKSYVEEKFENGEIKAICSTTTIAYGFDAPVRCVIVADLKRYSPEKGFMDYINTWEYLQWIGRAARPGKGFDRGYSFTFCKDKTSALNIFSEEMRELEPVESHLEDKSEFRKLLLELVSFGWDDIDSIMGIVNSTLYANSLDTSDGWSDFVQSDNDELVKSKVRGAINWMQNNGIIEMEHSREKIKSTELGEATVNFMLDSFVRVNLSQIVSLHNWIIGNPEVSKEQFVEKVCREFDISLGVDSVDGKMNNISEYKMLDEYSITAHIILNDWCENISLDRISEDYYEDMSFLPNVASKLSKLIESSAYLFELSIGIPRWYNNLPERVRYGIEEEHVIMVKNVNGLGRKRVDKLENYVETMLDSNEMEYENVLQGLNSLVEEFGSEEIGDTISNNVDGIGNEISENVMDFVKDYHG